MSGRRRPAIWRRNSGWRRWVPRRRQSSWWRRWSSRRRIGCGMWRSRWIRHRTTFSLADDHVCLKSHDDRRGRAIVSCCTRRHLQDLLALGPFGASRDPRDFSVILRWSAISSRRDLGVFKRMRQEAAASEHSASLAVSDMGNGVAVPWVRRRRCQWSARNRIRIAHSGRLT